MCAYSPLALLPGCAYIASLVMVRMCESTPTIKLEVFPLELVAEKFYYSIMSFPHQSDVVCCVFPFARRVVLREVVTNFLDVYLLAWSVSLT